MIFMGPLCQRGQECEIQQNIHRPGSNAASAFQWSILDGLCENLGQGVQVISALPVGTWPKHYSRIRLPDRQWDLRGAECHEVGCLNIPVLKQWTRYLRTRKLLRGVRGEKILLCTPYLPFLWALRKLDRSNQVTLIVTDLPEYADLHRVSGPRKWLRRIHSAMVYRLMDRVDRFVLLTEQMKASLRVGNRPYIVMEGICGVPEEEPEDGKRERAVLYSGRLNARYGIGNLLDAFSMLDDGEAELWICGGGEMETEIRAAAERDRRIRFFGFLPREEALALQRKAAVLVNPRQNTGGYTRYSFPSKTMEYMASGTPVLMYRLEGIPESYDPYLRYVSGSGVSDLAAGLREILSGDPAELEERSRAARQFVLTEKNAVVQAGRILALMGE